MNLTLRRKWLTDQTTIGELYVGGAFFSYTLEDVLRPAGVKIKHQTAIPAGRYEVVMSWSNRFQRVMPRLVNVPMFDGILIHVGNTSADTSGCILVGKMREKNLITESRSAFNRLYNLLAEAALSGKIWIEIYNPTNLPSESPQNAPEGKKATPIPVRVEKANLPGKAAQIPASDFHLHPPNLTPNRFPASDVTRWERVRESLRTGNTLPSSYAALLALRDFVIANKWIAALVAAIIVSALLIVAWIEFGPKRRKTR
jgi:hypothetical protein